MNLHRTLALALLPACLPAALLDFETAPTNTFISFSQDGAVVTSATTGLVGRTTPNGTRGLQTSQQIATAILVDFDTPVAFIAVDAGDFGGDEDTITLRALGDAGILATEVVVLPSDVSGMIRVSIQMPSAVIKRATINQLPDSTFFIDNFEFSTNVPQPQVPEPSTLLLTIGAAVAVLRSRS